MTKANARTWVWLGIGSTALLAGFVAIRIRSRSRRKAAEDFYAKLDSLTPGGAAGTAPFFVNGADAFDPKLARTARGTLLEPGRAKALAQTIWDSWSANKSWLSVWTFNDEEDVILEQLRYARSLEQVAQIADAYESLSANKEGNTLRGDISTRFDDTEKAQVQTILVGLPVSKR